jgi:Ribonuclease HI
MIRIYTDGAAQGNPGPGGYGTILKFNNHVKELSQGYRLTTNNRMELLAVIAGLEAIRKKEYPLQFTPTLNML